MTELEMLRAQIAADTLAYLQAGGVVTVGPPTRSKREKFQNRKVYHTVSELQRQFPNQFVAI